MKYKKVEFRFEGENGSELSEDLLQLSRDILPSMVEEVGFESFADTPSGVEGYVPVSVLDRHALEASIEMFPVEGVSVSYTVTDAENRNWNEEWERNGFDPIIVSDTCVIHDRIRPYDGPQMPLDVVIEARQAFGTGTHETTRLMVAELLRLDLKGKRVLDCGCGTGILSIVSSLHGARLVVGYDIDEWSVENSRHNASLNGVENVEILHGDVHVLSHVNGVFDVVVANINRNVLLADMEHFTDVLSADGYLLLSGFYPEDSMSIAERAGELGLSLERATDENNWCCLVFRH